MMILPLQDIRHEPPANRDSDKGLCQESWPNEHTTQDPSKKHDGPSHPDFPPRRFWEQLSKPELTRNALRALASLGSLGPRLGASHRPVVGTESTIDQHSADIFLRGCSMAALKRIRRFASHGGPDLEDVRGCPFTWPKDKMSGRESSRGRRKRGSRFSIEGSGSGTVNTTTAATTSTRITGPYDGNFQQHLTEHRVYPERYRYPDGRALPEPDNLDEIMQMLNQPRPSLFPSHFSEAAFDEFQGAVAYAAKEEVMAMVIPIIEGKPEHPNSSAGQIAFRNLDHLTDGSLVAGNPDIYYGARPEQLQAGIRSQLGGSIVPSTQDSLPVVPNFFLHVEGPDGSLSVASRQACYDGALGARGIHALQSYGRPEEEHYDNKAYNPDVDISRGTAQDVHEPSDSAVFSGWTSRLRGDARQDLGSDRGRRFLPSGDGCVQERERLGEASEGYRHREGEREG
ncbi:hypothetical protein CP532_2529 [Ophiocordyceps camponoti-leonardi (nom. inval.)]|nr:hypothetical protein CP532_2529 [Ophiocordyceps camponoti-leonardi (nom. inval.)]